MTTPLDEFLEEFGPTEKKANPSPASGAFKGFGENFGRAMIGGLGAGAATAAIGAGAIAAKSLMAAATKSRDFRAMLSHNQDLEDHHRADPRRFNQLYTSLHTMNPTFARDPIVAGTYMRQMLESPLNAGGILASTVGSRDAIPSLLDRSRDEAIGASKSHFSRRSGGSPNSQ